MASLEKSPPLRPQTEIFKIIAPSPTPLTIISFFYSRGYTCLPSVLIGS